VSLSAHNLSFAFGQRPVLRGITTDFPAGAVTAILGPNGAGKSTLLRLLLGVLSPHEGSIEIGGRPLASLTRHERAAAMAYVPQSSQVAFAFSVAEVVRLGRYAAGKGEDARSISAALTKLDIADRLDDSFGHLSAGQQQRVTVARALAQLDGAGGSGGPKVLLADEPVSAMDPSHTLRTMELFEQLAKQGLCVVVVLHDLSLVLRYAQRVVVLGAEGQIAGQGETAATLTPQLLSQVYGVDFRAIADPQSPARPAAMIPVR
jgi:iron complex transport system ATP-binding protein